MAQWLKADGTAQEVEPLNCGVFGYRHLQEMVGGYLEVFIIDANHYRRATIVNEEGALHNLPINQEATILCGRRIVGDVVLIGIIN